MSCCGEGKLVTFELTDARLVTLDLDCQDDFGDIEFYRDSESDMVTIGIRNDEDNPDSLCEVVRCFEELDNDDANRDFIEKKWQTFGEVDKLEVVEWLMVRMLCFCDGYCMEDLKRDLDEYGIDIDKVYIPEEWRR